MIQGEITRRKVMMAGRARLRCRKSRRPKAETANGRITERVRAVSPRKKPESKKFTVVGRSLGFRRKKKEVRSENRIKETSPETLEDDL